MVNFSLIGFVVEPVKKDLNLRELEGITLSGGGTYLGYGIDFDCPYWSYKVKALRLLNKKGEVRELPIKDYMYSKNPVVLDYSIEMNAILGDFIYNCKGLYVKLFNQSGLNRKLNNMCALVDLSNSFAGYVLCNIPLIGCSEPVEIEYKALGKFIKYDVDRTALVGVVKDKLAVPNGDGYDFVDWSNFNNGEYGIVELYNVLNNLVDKDGCFGLRN